MYDIDSNHSAALEAMAKTTGLATDALMDFGREAHRAALSFGGAAVVFAEVKAEQDRRSLLHRQSIAKARGKNWRAVK